MFVDGNGYILGTAVIVTSILQQSEICLDYKCGFSSFCHRNCHFDLSSPYLCSGGTWCRLCILRAWALLYFTGNEQFPTPGYWMHTVSMGSVVCLWAAFSSLFSQDICDVTWTTQTARLVAGRHLLHLLFGTFRSSRVIILCVCRWGFFRVLFLLREEWERTTPRI